MQSRTEVDGRASQTRQSFRIFHISCKRLQQPAYSEAPPASRSFGFPRTELLRQQAALARSSNRLQALTPTAGAKPRQNGLNRHNPSLLTHAPSWLGQHAHQPSVRLTRHAAGPPHPAAHKNKPLSQQSTQAVTWTSHPDPERQTQT